MSITTCLYVVAGGAIGTLARYLISLAALPISRSLPWGTIGINIAGSFIIGFVGTLTLMQGRYPLPETARLFIMVGFYLLDLGFVTLFMRISGTVQTARASFEALSTKLGTVLLVLGLIHLLSVLILSVVRRRATRSSLVICCSSGAGMARNTLPSTLGATQSFTRRVRPTLCVSTGCRVSGRGGAGSTSG